MVVDADPNFGKILLEQKPNRGNFGNAIFLLMLGIPMTLVVVAPNAPAGVRLGFGGFGLCLCAFVAIMLWRNWMHVFLQEFGIREYRQGQGRSLRYDQVDELIYSSLRIFGHGSYIRTVQKLALKSDRIPGRPVVCTFIFKEADGRAQAETRTAVTDIRDHISRRLAECFLELAQRGQVVDWLPEIRMRRRGLDLADGRGGCEFIEWQRVSRYAIDEGLFKLWIDAETKPRLQISTTAPNFYPAYMLAQRLRNLPRS